MEIGILTQGFVRSDSTAQDRIREVVAEARYADEMGLAAFGVSEQHFKFPVNSTAPITTIMAAIAQCTEQIKIIPGVVILPFHHPLTVAENWAAIDIISKGRLYFGVGKGNTPFTSDVYRVPIKDTVPLSDEVLEIIIRSWTQEKFSFDGKFFQIPELSLCPQPWKRPHPPLGSAGNSIPAARYAGDRKLGFMTGTLVDSWEDVQSWLDAYDTAWETGKPIANATPDKTKSVLVPGWVGDDYDEVAEQAGDGTMRYVNRYVEYKRVVADRSGTPNPSYGEAFLDNFQVIYDTMPNAFGTPDLVIKKLRRMKEMGFDRVDVTLDYATHEDILKCIKRLATEVMPALN